MDGGEEGGGVFGVACRDATPAFEVQKGVLDAISQLVQILIMRALDCAVFLRRDKEFIFCSESNCSSGAGEFLFSS